MSKRKKRIFFETEEIIHKTKRGYIDLDTDYFQFYSIAFHYLASLSNNCAKDFILWVMSRVDDNNEFSYNHEMFADFTADLQKIFRPKTYSENTLHVSLRELVDNKVLSRIGRGRYKVNPRLFWSDDTSKRIDAIKYLEANSRVEPTLIEGIPLPAHEEDDLPQGRDTFSPEVHAHG